MHEVWSQGNHLQAQLRCLEEQLEDANERCSEVAARLQAAESRETDLATGLAAKHEELRAAQLRFSQLYSKAEGLQHLLYERQNALEQQGLAWLCSGWTDLQRRLDASCRMHAAFSSVCNESDRQAQGPTGELQLWHLAPEIEEKSKKVGQWLGSICTQDAYKVGQDDYQNIDL